MERSGEYLCKPYALVRGNTRGNVVNQTPSDDGLIIEGGALFDACVQV